MEPTRRPRARRLLAGLAAGMVLLAGCGGSGGGGGDAADFPEEDITFLVGVTPGGGFDTWARALAPYLEEHLPGDGSVVVENLTGAGGLRMVNTMLASEPDGLTIAITNTIGLASAQVSGQAENLDLEELTWLGRLSDEPMTVLVRDDSEFQTMADLQAAAEDAPLRGAITSLGASLGVGALLVADAYELDWTPVTHDGGTEASLSLVRGDTDFMVDSLFSRADEVAAGDLRPIVNLSEQTSEELPEASALDDGHDALVTALGLRRDIAAPPDLPEEIRQALADALTQALEEPDLQAEIEAAGLQHDTLSADDLQSSVVELVDVYEQHEQLLTEALQE
jgi:tripartite-type tricarboxylate transporter receptor subunit TctC